MIEKLINGFLVLHEEDREEREFYLLNFLKNLDNHTSPAIDQFITDLLALTGMHTSLSISKTLIQRECKIFSRLRKNSPMSLRLAAEKELNSLIRDYVDEKNSVIFLMPEKSNKKAVRLFVKADALKTLEFLRINYISIFIHLSPLYIDKLFEWSVAKFGAKKCPQDKIQLIHFSIKKYYKIASENIEAVEAFRHYGYEIKLNKLAYSKILFKSANNQEVHPAGNIRENMVATLETNLKNFSYGNCSRIDNVFNFVRRYHQNFANLMRSTETEVKALQHAVKFLKESREQLNNIKNSFPSDAFSGLFLFCRERGLVKAINQTEEAMHNLETSIGSLTKKSCEGGIALMLHSL